MSLLRWFIVTFYLEKVVAWWCRTKVRGYYIINLETDHLTCRGCGEGGYVFLFRSEIFFQTTQELEYLFFLSRQNQNIFFSNIGNQNIFLQENHNPPPFKLNGRPLSSLRLIPIFLCFTRPLMLHILH